MYWQDLESESDAGAELKIVHCFRRGHSRPKKSRGQFDATVANHRIATVEARDNAR